MSTLHTNTVETSSGGPVTLTKQSAAKSWSKFNGGGTVAIAASLNVSSVSDHATGNFSTNFTSNFSSGSYSSQVNGDWTLGTDSGLTIHSGNNVTITSSVFRMWMSNSSFADYDVDGVCTTQNGDLA